MSGLLRRLTRRGHATADENRSAAIESSDPAAAPAETPADAGGDRPVPAGDAGGDRPVPASETGGDRPATASDEQATQLLPATSEQTVAHPVVAPRPDAPGDQPTAFAAQPAPARDLPAGVDPADLAGAPPASARRGKLRRRLRYLRHVRLLLLRDLGGFTYEIHRSAGGTAQESHRKLATAKAERISAIDGEVAALEARLGEPHAGSVLREPGIGGTCRECGELHASDAHYCSRCGEPLDDRARARRDAAIAAAAKPDPSPAADAQPASVLWAGAAKQAGTSEPEPDRPAEITSEWLRTGAGQPTTFDRAAQPGEPAPSVNPWVATSERATASAAATTPAASEPTGADEPLPTRDEAATPAEPAASEPIGADEPPTTPDEAATPAEPAASEPIARAADEPIPPAGDEPVGADAAIEPKPKRSPRRPKPAAAEPETSSAPASEPETSSAPAFEPETSSAPAFEPNGRRDEDVPAPEPDPLFPPREQS